MPVYVKGDHEVNVSGEEEVARFVAAGYSPKTAAPGSSESKAPAKKAAAKPSKK